MRCALDYVDARERERKPPSGDWNCGSNQSITFFLSSKLWTTRSFVCAVCGVRCVGDDEINQKRRLNVPTKEQRWPTYIRTSNTDQMACEASPPAVHMRSHPNFTESFGAVHSCRYTCGVIHFHQVSWALTYFFLPEIQHLPSAGWLRPTYSCNAYF